MPKDERTPVNPQGEQQPQEKIEIVDENLKQGFAQMPRPVLRAKGLSLKAKAVYLLLLDYAWQTDSCFPGQERLAADLDTSVDTIQRGLQELRAYGLVDWKRQGLNKPNLYLILKLSDCKKLTHSEAETANSGIKKPQDCGIKKPQDCGTKNTKSKNTKMKNTKSFRKANALKTEKGGEGTASTRSHRERMATGKQNTRGVKNGNTKQERQPAYIGKPLTQEEIDEKRRNNQNASGFTPLAGIIPASHWQELEAHAAAHPTNGNGNSNGNLHYHHTTKNAPLSIDATIEQLSTLLHDEPVVNSVNVRQILR